MSDDHQQHRPWEPDPRRVGTNWTAMFDQTRGSGPAPTSPSEQHVSDDDASATDLTAYRPWTLQRGQSRPALMLSLRRFDPRAGHWIGWGLAYPSLFEVEYVGDRVLSLDFGIRQFMIEGCGLDELARRIKQGSVLAILEYAPSIWAIKPDGPLVTAIRRIDAPG